MRVKQKSRETNGKLILRENLNGAHHLEKTYQSKTGVNIHVSLKKKILLFGESMKKDFGKNTMHVYAQMGGMVNMKKQENLKDSLIYL